MRRKSGTIIMMVGVALAAVAGVIVFAMARQANADRTAQIPQVLVVMASQNVPLGTAITAGDLTMQAFPSDFVPHGAVANPDQAVGKYTTTTITKGQIVLTNQLSTTLQAGELSLSVPSGMVAVALPMTDLMSANGAIKAGDYVDVLLTLDLHEIQLEQSQANAGTPQSSPSGSTNAKNPVTQTTLQGVEVLSVGQSPNESSGGSSATSTGSSSSTSKGAVIVAVSPQDALVVKYAKDSGGIVDLALRPSGDTKRVTTDPVTIDRLFSRFNFQRPGPVP